MSETLALRGREIAAIHLEDWFHPSDTSWPITALDAGVCDYLAVRWRDSLAAGFGCSECDNHREESGGSATPDSRISHDGVRAPTLPCPDTVPLSLLHTVAGRFPMEFRLHGDPAGLDRELTAMLLRLRQRARVSLLAAR